MPRDLEIFFLYQQSGRFPDSQITESFHKIKTDTTSMLQQFMNVVSEIFPDTLWQPDSAFSHIYAMTYYNPAFFCIQWPQPFRHFT